MSKRTKKRMQQPEAIEAIEPDLFADDFFREPTPAPVDSSWDDEPQERPTIAADKRRAMVATLVIFGVFAVGVGGFTVYSKLIMPTPVTLNASSATFTLPTAPIAEPTPSVAPMPVAIPAPTPAPIAAPSVAAVATEKAPPASAPVEEVAPAVTPEPAIAPSTSSTAAPIEPRAAPRRSTSAHRSAPAPAADESLSAQAMRALNGGSPSDARRLAQQAVQQNPERADGWIVLGAAHDALGDHAAALTAYATCTARALGPRVATCKALAR